ncbi:MAG: YbjN domain-containing protein [Parachlamydia sp.]|nr:YbjN domain-containing protein [Parachlamydia sp.]
MKLTTKNIQKALKSAEIDSELQKGPKEFPLEEILVPLGADPRGEEMVMQIGLITRPLEGDEEEGALQFIQFLIMIPLKIEQPQLADTQAFINLMNAVIELPGFGVLDSERLPFFRYTMLCNREEVDEELFVMTVGLILHTLDTYLETLEEIAQGHKRFADFLSEIQAG